MIRLIVAFLLTLLVALSPAVAQEGDTAVPQMPKELVIGYEEEGHVDASDASCRVFVDEVVEWDKAEMDQAVRDVCAVRKRHADAYAALQSAYRAFRAEVAVNPRFDGTAAAKHVAQMIKSCIDHKWAISTGGHNIGIDMVPNAIDADCLDVGRDLLTKETAHLKGE